jgi:5-methylcytosine-specific restriction endonuclease McrA
MNTYSDSQDKRYTTPQIERKIKKSALELLELQFIEHGYNFCDSCKRSSGTYLDVSHTISRKKAKENGKVEVLWDLDNLEILCRKCHQLKDKLL